MKTLYVVGGAAAAVAIGYLAVSWLNRGNQLAALTGDTSVAGVGAPFKQSPAPNAGGNRAGAPRPSNAGANPAAGGAHTSNPTRLPTTGTTSNRGGVLGALGRIGTAQNPPGWDNTSPEALAQNTQGSRTQESNENVGDFFGVQAY